MKQNTLHRASRGLHALHFSVSSGLVVVLGVALFMQYVGSSLWLWQVGASGYGVFSANSFWNTRLPRYPTENPAGSTLSSQLAQSASLGAIFDTSDAASPVYEVDVTTPTVAVLFWDCGIGTQPDLATQWQAVPIPFYAEPSDGAAHRMSIYQPATQTIWEFGQMHKQGENWYACSGGRIDAATYSNGVFGGTGGSMESGLAVMGGQVSVADLRRGSIGHAIGLTVPSTGNAVWPASHGGSGGMVPLGQRFQLDPSINVDALGLSPVARMIAKASQQYGFVVWGSSSTVSIMGENPKSYTARGLLSPYGGLGGSSLANFPWDKLRALPSEYGRYGQTPDIQEFATSTTAAQAGEIVHFSWRATNVDECAIPGVAGSLAAHGAVDGTDLRGDTDYTLTCTGPGGSVSRRASISVNGLPENSPLPIISTTTITAPVSATVSILPLLDTEWARQTVQKVAYYERGNLLMAVTTPPFALDTTVLPDGPHSLSLSVFFRDGHKEAHNATIRVQNKSEPFVPTGPLSMSTPSRIGQTILIVGLTTAIATMVGGFVVGWRLYHPRPKKQPLSWLVSYVR